MTTQTVNTVDANHAAYELISQLTGKNINHIINVGYSAEEWLKICKNAKYLCNAEIKISNIIIESEIILKAQETKEKFEAAWTYFNEVEKIFLDNEQTSKQ